jgi:hypothetical protein
MEILFSVHELARDAVTSFFVLDMGDHEWTAAKE